MKEEILEKPAKVLVVEDEPILALELQEDLKDLGYDVPPVVNDGDMVLKSVVQYHPDVILMDIKLYGFRDGIESATQVRGFYQTPIIYLSSYPESQVSDRIQKTKPTAYLEKPYDLPTLRNVIQRALGKPV